MDLVAEKLTVEYVRDGYTIRPLDGLDFRASSGELVVLLGPSGTGKTTLLSCFGGILTPKSGSIRLGDVDVTALNGPELQRYRRTSVGIVFQSFNLIPSLTALENVAIPMLMARRSRRDSFARARKLLDMVGLTDRSGHLPAHLSGGQQQRVAIARGLVADPPLLLADEPTANLDYIQAESVIRVLRELRADGRIVIVSSHDARLVPIADRVHEMVPDTDANDRPPESVQFAAGSSIFEQGDTADRVYRIVSGEVDILQLYSDGREEALNRLHAGQYFGELALLLGFPRSASARARTDVTATSYGIRDFRREVLLPVAPTE